MKHILVSQEFIVDEVCPISRSSSYVIILEDTIRWIMATHVYVVSYCKDYDVGLLCSLFNRPVRYLHIHTKIRYLMFNCVVLEVIFEPDFYNPVKKMFKSEQNFVCVDCADWLARFENSQW